MIKLRLSINSFLVIIAVSINFDLQTQVSKLLTQTRLLPAPHVAIQKGNHSLQTLAQFSRTIFSAFSKIDVLKNPDHVLFLITASFAFLIKTQYFLEEFKEYKKLEAEKKIALTANDNTLKIQKEDENLTAFIIREQLFLNIGAIAAKQELIKCSVRNYINASTPNPHETLIVNYINNATKNHTAKKKEIEEKFERRRITIRETFQRKRRANHRLSVVPLSVVVGASFINGCFSFCKLLYKEQNKMLKFLIEHPLKALSNVIRGKKPTTQQLQATIALFLLRYQRYLTQRLARL